MTLTDYCVICFVILEFSHFYLVCFDMEKDAVTVIDNMDVTGSPIKLVNDDDFFKKTTPFKVKDVFKKHLKLVNHPKFLSFEATMSKRLDFEWATVGNSVVVGCSLCVIFES
ncbi:hypothetical protein Hdeb2414_s0189g00827791 [Helianthus debilis subsp. tardiflorus]